MSGESLLMPLHDSEVGRSWWEEEYAESLATLFRGDYRDARAYHRRALQYRRAGQAYSLVFNLAAVALERYLIAFCELHGVEPRGHNFISLAATLGQCMPLPDRLSSEIKSLDRIFGICGLDDYYHGVPQEADSVKALRLCHQIKQLLCNQLKTLNTPAAAIRTPSCAERNVK